MANDYEKDAQAINDIANFVSKYRTGSNLSSMLQQLSNNVIGNPNAGKTSSETFLGTSSEKLPGNGVARNDNEPYSDVFDKHMARNSLSHKDPYAFNQISYPPDVTTNMENGHYMLFYVNVQNKSKYHYKDYKGVDVGGVTTVFNKGEGNEGPRNQYAVGDSYTERASDANFKLNLLKTGTPGNYHRGDVTELSKSQQDARTGMRTWAPTTTRITDSIALYLPGSISNNLTAEYDPAAMGVIGFAAATGLQFADQFGADDFEGAAKTLKGAVGNVGEEIIQRALAGIADLTTGVSGTYEFANKIFGRATNPYMEVLFKEMPLRSFDYTFTFQPKDQRERDDVQNIIKTFRFHMAPELQEQNMRFMGIPSTFDIHYMYQEAQKNVPTDWRATKENSYLNKIATCILTKCDVSYEDAAKSFRDGSPTKVTMALSFTETEMITKEKINEGF